MVQQARRVINIRYIVSNIIFLHQKLT